MLLFGNLAGQFGRKRMYGLELSIVIIATLGLTQASSGFNGTMQIQPWLI
jgi:PHS family inorganic phosphate transporter-like MFS transporter